MIAEQYKVGRTQIQNTIKRKAEFIRDFDNLAPLNKKRRVRAAGNEEINDLTLKWFISATQRKINVTGHMLKDKALHFAQDLSVRTFSASNGWIESFVKRNNLAFGKLCGKSGDVDEEIVNNWK